MALWLYTARLQLNSSEHFCHQPPRACPHHRASPRPHRPSLELRRCAYVPCPMPGHGFSPSLLQSDRTSDWQCLYLRRANPIITISFQDWIGPLFCMYLQSLPVFVPSFPETRSIYKQYTPHSDISTQDKTSSQSHSTPPAHQQV